MINLKNFKNKKIVVFGLGLTGIATVEALRAAGAKVIAADDKPQDITGLSGKIHDVGMIDWNKVDYLVLSPGIPHVLPQPHVVAVRANELKIPIICDIELLALARPEAKFVCITGTNGKSTTTALIGHILQGHFKKVAIGGNLGVPALALDDQADIYVLELSSYQLERCPSLTSDVAVWLNITPDHIDRHGDLDGYIAAKKNIFTQGKGMKMAVIGQDDPHSSAVTDAVDEMGEWQICKVSGHGMPDQGYGMADGNLLFVTGEEEPQACMEMRSHPRLKGAHNYQNTAAAWAACSAMGVPNMVIEQQVQSFEGLPHRQYLVKTINSVAYINDSKATNADAAICALQAYGAIHWICGGMAKEGGLEGTQAYLSHVRKAYLIGQCAPDFEEWLQKHGVETEICETMDNAVHAAHINAQADRGLPGKTPVVLMSPATASWDQYKSFGARGDDFARLVEGLKAD